MSRDQNLVIVEFARGAGEGQHEHRQQVDLFGERGDLVTDLRG